ncbi:MAG: reverse transcriptase domain-containing protein [Pyrinomonadaceae bacterium]
MKRKGNLWPQVIDENNLFLAAKKAAKGKRFQENILIFNSRLGENIVKLRRELETGSYAPGEYRTFEIFEPKRRMISAAPFRDRVVHHALCNVIQPIFETGFISDSYANRTGYGTHKALKRFTEFARSSKYVLQCDIERYFPSIDHEILKSLIRRKIKCPETLWLIDTIIDNSNEQEPRNIYFEGDNLFTPFERRRGLPIGNLTSQFFANVYLNGLDHFVREDLKTGKYVRYVDDFSLFHRDQSVLRDARLKIEDYLAGFRLRIHKVKSQLFETRKGANFVGFRVLSDTIRVRSDNLRRARWRLRQMRRDYRKGCIDSSKIKERLMSWIAHLEHGDTFQLRSRVFSGLVFSRS